MKFSSLAPRDLFAAISISLFIVFLVFIPRILAIAPVIVAAILFTFSKMRGQKFSMPAASLFVWALIFPALMMVSALWAYDSAVALERGLKTLPVFLSLPFLVTGLSGLNTHTQSLLRYFSPIAVLISSIYMTADLLSGGMIYKLSRGMDIGAPLNLSNLNRSVVVLTFFALIAIGILRLEKRWRMLAVLSFFTVCALFLSHSQSAQLGFVIGFAAIFLFPAAIRAPWYAAGALMASAIIGAPWAAGFLYNHFLQSPAMLAVREAYMPERIEIWQFIARRALENPLLGFGADSTGLMQFDTARIFVSGDTAMHPHNFAIQLWVEFGFIGALIGAVCLLKIMQAIYKTKTGLARSAVLGPFFAAVSIAATSYGLWQGWFLGLFILTFALTANLVHKSDDNHAI